MPLSENVSPVDPQLLSSQLEQKPLEPDLSNIYLRSTMKQNNAPIQDDKKIKKFFNNMFSSIAQVMTTDEQGIPAVALGSGCESDVYCEVAYNYKETSFEVSWRLKNPGVQDWPINLSIAPVVCSPSVRSFTETNIC